MVKSCQYRDFEEALPVRQMKKISSLLLLSALLLSACAHSSDKSEDAAAEQGSVSQPSSTSSQATDSDQLSALTLDNAAESDVLVIDVRTPEEFAGGHIPGAKNVPLDSISTEIASVASDKDEPLALYCRSGNRSGQALALLEDAGYTAMVNLGGIMNYSGPLETGN
ncbi:MAG: rhodanese-like domain-containing protein [Actinomycetaceae bacterium]|nr:rhodanese-like domain-containing protein [Actinomycetaceae bacterium]